VHAADCLLLFSEWIEGLGFRVQLVKASPIAFLAVAGTCCRTAMRVVLCSNHAGCKKANVRKAVPERLEPGRGVVRGTGIGTRACPEASKCKASDNASQGVLT